MRLLFVDTGAWIALAIRRDQMHQPAAQYAEELVRKRIPLLTTNYVLL